MSADRPYARAYVLLGLVMLLWAGNSIVGRAVRFDVGPFTLAFVRWAGASLVVLPFALRSLRRDWSAILASWKAVLLLGLLGVGAFNALLYTGLHFTTATNALLLQAAIPPAVMAFDRLFFGTRASGREGLGVGLSILGVALIVFEGDPAAAARLHFGAGDLLILASVVVWALYTVLLRLKPAIAPLSFVAATFWVGVVTMAPLAAWEWHAGAPFEWGPKLAGAFVYVAVLPSVLSYLIFNSASQVVGAARAGQAITLMPLFGAFLSAALLGEKLHGYHFAGMALILAGIVVAALAPRAAPR